MNVHFIAIGGSAMHNLAIALHKKGYNVSGSDDEIFEPSRTRLKKYGLLPSAIGWNTNLISKDLDAVILGMHARADNPELLKAKELGIKIFSYPEYLYEQSKNKKRVVIGGSHGKTTITAMIMHVLNFHGIDHDYMVGAQLEGFDTMVRLSEQAPVAIFEGDEYLSSPIDRRPKFHLYKPHIALLSGIAWDHINVFPSFENYIEQFQVFIEQISENGLLVYCMNDPVLVKTIKNSATRAESVGYSTHPSINNDGETYLIHNKNKTRIEVFGKHNLDNINGARIICNALDLSDAQFYEAISCFKGASKRLELLGANDDTKVFLDFAHSPSKLLATTTAVKEQFPDRKLVACMELHTFSSLTEEFLLEYEGSMAAADMAIVYFNPETIKHKKLKEISKQTVIDAFGGDNVIVFTDPLLLTNTLLSMQWANKNLLMMSSGTFSGINYKDFAKQIISS